MNAIKPYFPRLAPLQAASRAIAEHLIQIARQEAIYGQQVLNSEALVNRVALVAERAIAAEIKLNRIECEEIKELKAELAYVKKQNDDLRRTNERREMMLAVARRSRRDEVPEAKKRGGLSREEMALNAMAEHKDILR